MPVLFIMLQMPDFYWLGFNRLVLRELHHGIQTNLASAEGPVAILFFELM